MAAKAKSKRKPRKSAKKKPEPKRAKRVKPTDGHQAYEKHREQAAARFEAISIKGREIGPIPDIANVARREACLNDPQKFFMTYNPKPFTFSFSPEHNRGIGRIKDAFINGGFYAFSWRRGGGKTTTCRMASLWAMSNAILRYMAMIGANAPRAQDNLEAVKTMMRHLPLFAADFPEIAYPVKKLNGIAQRAKGQLCCGRPTLMEWSDDRIILPTVPPPANWPKHWPLREDGMVPTSGSILAAAGLTSDGIRGLLITLETGEMLRPDAVLLDDPQTRESAKSPTQNADREQLVSADVLGLAGPGQKFAAVLPCTPIVPGDMADSMLDRKKHPAWRGERAKTLSAMPKNMDAWEEYFEVYRQCIELEPRDITQANEHYVANRAVLDEGTKAEWEDCKKPDEVSAIQSAMHIYFERGRRAFMAEYQGEPEIQEEVNECRQLTEADLTVKLNNYDRAIVPHGHNRLTFFIDVQQEVLLWLIPAWTPKFGGSIIDYGTYPPQVKPTFTMSTINPKLSDVFMNQDVKTRIYSGLMHLVPWLFNRAFKQEEASGGLTLSMGMIDTGFNADVVHEFISRSPFKAMLKASKGRGIQPQSKPLNEYRNDPGDDHDWNWRSDAKTTAKGRLVTYDTNAWKSAMADGLLAPSGAATSIHIFGKEISQHPLLAMHLLSEHRTPIENKITGRTVQVWTKGAAENHLWDCFVGAGVAASVSGLKWNTAAEAGDRDDSGDQPEKPMKLSEIQKAKQAAGAYGKR